MRLSPQTPLLGVFLLAFLGFPPRYARAKSSLARHGADISDLMKCVHFMLILGVFHMLGILLVGNWV